MTDDPRTIPPAPCLTRPEWRYHTADSHEVNAGLFRDRQYARLIEAQPKLREVNEQERRAA